VFPGISPVALKTPGLTIPGDSELKQLDFSMKSLQLLVSKTPISIPLFETQLSVITFNSILAVVATNFIQEVFSRLPQKIFSGSGGLKDVNRLLVLPQNPFKLEIRGAESQISFTGFEFKQTAPLGFGKINFVLGLAVTIVPFVLRVEPKPLTTRFEPAFEYLKTGKPLAVPEPS
jgi:hypothetical protein